MSTIPKAPTKKAPTKAAVKKAEPAKPAAVKKAEPVKQAPATKPEPAPQATTYTMGSAKYNPRVEHNAIAWDKVKAFITIKGKGKATHTQLCEVLKDHHSKTGETHHDFIGYLERRGTIAKLEA